MAKKAGKHPPDQKELSTLVVDQLTGNEEPPKETPAKNPVAVSLGRLGGLKGGPVRAKKMTAKQRSESARKAARAKLDSDNGKWAK